MNGNKGRTQKVLLRKTENMDNNCSSENASEEKGKKEGKRRDCWGILVFNCFLY